MDRKTLIGLSFIAVALIVLITIFLKIYVTSRTLFGIDFYVYWLASKAMFLEGISPYSQKVALQAQLGILGRSAYSFEDQSMFLNPPYSLLILLPTILMNYQWALAYWIAFNLVLLIVISRLAFPDLPAWIIMTIPFLYAAARGFVIGQFSLLIGTLFLLVHYLISNSSKNQHGIAIMAGIVLSWLTIKPQLTWLLILFYLLYALKKRLWFVFLGFSSGCIILSIFSWILVPTWPMDWIRQGFIHTQSVEAKSWLIKLVDIIYPSPWTELFGWVIILAGLVWITWLFIDWWRGYTSTLIAILWIVLVTQFVNIYSRPPEQIIFLLPVLLWLSQEDLSGNRFKYAVWMILLLVPYLGFFFNFSGRETFEASLVLPVLIIIWGIYITYKDKFSLSDVT